MASGADRLSPLPDELLHHVLSFLPAHEVVSTSLIAHRWRDLWKSAPALRVTGVKDCNNAGWFTQYIDNLLLHRHPGARLDSFELDLDERDFGFKAFLPAYDSNVNLWIRLALLCQAREITLRTTYGVYTEGNDDLPMKLPNVPIISQHLRRLDLELVRLDRGSLDFSGCPVLVDLKMTNCEFFGNLSSPFLKHLNITGCYIYTGSFRPRICTPGLVSLVLSDFNSMTPQLENMPLLVSAIVRFTEFCLDICPRNTYGDRNDPTCSGCYDMQDGDNDRRGESTILKGLSQVTGLELSVHWRVCIVNRDLQLCPAFRKLKTLSLGEWCPDVVADLNILTYFLQHAPILEKITLQLSEAPEDLVKTERNYEPLEKSFACSLLIMVEIKCEEGDARVGKVLDILCTRGIPFEKITIQHNNRASGP
ncbi:hypothetical protein ACP70R_003834 [Stipagrostis hirtigluma subsp. patula]